MPGTTARKSPLIAIAAVLALIGLAVSQTGPSDDGEKSHDYAFVVDTTYGIVDINVKRSNNFQPSVVDGTKYPFTYRKPREKTSGEYAEDGAYNPKIKGRLTVIATMKRDPTLIYKGHVGCVIYSLGSDGRKEEVARDDTPTKNKAGLFTVSCIFNTPHAVT